MTGKVWGVAKEPSSSVVAAATVGRRLGTIERPFAAMLRRPGLGAAVVQDIVNLEHALAVGLAGQDEANEAWKAFDAVYSRLNDLPPSERFAVAAQLEERRWQILAMDRDYTALFDEPTREAIKEMNDAVRAGKATGRAALKAVKQVDKLTGKVLARVSWLQLAAAGTDRPELVGLMSLFFARVPLGSSFSVKAAEEAIGRANRIWKILEEEGAVAGRKRALAELVNIRSPLGEGYALFDPAVHAERMKRLARAEQLANSLGEGHIALDVNQVEHGLKYPDGHGPDAMILIYDTLGNKLIPVDATEIKTALTSEGVEQLVKGPLRESGIFQFGKKSGMPPFLTLRLPGSTEPVTLPVAAHARVERTAMVVNALDSTIPGSDLDTLGTFAAVVDERAVELTVEQHTHVALMYTEAALEVAMEEGLITQAPKALVP